MTDHHAGNTQPKREKDWRNIEKQVHRYLHLERLLPSYHNRISVACLKVMKRLQTIGKARHDLDFFVPYTRYGYYRKVSGCHSFEPLQPLRCSPSVRIRCESSR